MEKMPRTAEQTSKTPEKAAENVVSIETAQKLGKSSMVAESLDASELVDKPGTFKLPPELMDADKDIHSVKALPYIRKKVDYLINQEYKLTPNISDFDEGGRHEGTRPKTQVDKDRKSFEQSGGNYGGEDTFWDDTLETIPYVLSEYGAFADEDGRMARPVFISDYDKKMSGVELALEIPWTWESKNGDGGKKKGYTTIAINVNAGMSRNADKQRNKVDSHMDDSGLIPEIVSPLKYAVNKAGQPVGGMSQMDEFEEPKALRYVVGLDMESMIKLFKEDNLRDEKERDRVEYILARQLSSQSYAKMLALKLRSKSGKLSRAEMMQWSNSAVMYEHFKETCHRLEQKGHFKVGDEDSIQSKILSESYSARDKLNEQIEQKAAS